MRSAATLRAGSRFTFLCCLLALLGAGAGCSLAGLGRPAAPQDEAHWREVLRENLRDASAHLALAKLLVESGEAKEAALHFDRVAELDAARAGEVEAARRGALRRYQDEARTLLDAGKPEEATSRLDAADAMVRDDAQTRYLHGRLFEDTDRAAAALPHFRAAWDAAPGNGERRDALERTLVAAAQERYEAEDYAAAFDLLREAAKVDPDADLAYLTGVTAYALAQSLGTEDRAPEDVRGVKRRRLLEQAEAAFRKAARQDPEDDDSRLRLASVLLALDRPTEAVDTYRALLPRQAEDAELYSALAHAYERSGARGEGTTARLLGKALAAGKPVLDPQGWAERTAARHPGSDLFRALAQYGTPEAIHTHAPAQGSLIEVWIYRKAGRTGAFQDGAGLGWITWP